VSIRSYKPCSVLTTIYLSNAYKDQFSSLSLSPLPNLGFSLVGFTAFHFIISNKLRHCGTFRDSTMVSFRYPPAVTYSYVPSVIFSASAITTSIAARASMDFPLQMQRLSRPEFQLFNCVRIESVRPKKFF